METLVTFVINLVHMIFNQEGLTLAFALGMVAQGNIAAGVLQNVRRWHGGITDKFAAIDNLVNEVMAHQSTWAMPAALLTQLTTARSEVLVLINQCRSNSSSRVTREQRNALLKSTIELCLLQVKVWAYGKYTEGVMTAEDVHLLGFLLPGETGGHHSRVEATDVTAEVKVKIINQDFIRVVIDQSAGENAGQVVHGWPTGVSNALIVIVAADGKTEVYRQLTTRLHNDIRMPEGSHGKQFIIKASFLKHIDDEPRFGNEPTFSMPLTTEDLAAALGAQENENNKS